MFVTKEAATDAAEDVQRIYERMLADGYWPSAKRH